MKVYKKTACKSGEDSFVKILDDLIIAESFIARLAGLILRPRLLKGQGLLIKDCNSIHTFWLRYNIDAIFLDQENKIVEIIKDIKPFRFTRIIRPAVSVLEVLSSSVVGHDLKLNDMLVFY